MCSSRPSRASPGGSACKTTRRNALVSLQVRRRGKVTLVFTRSLLWCALASDAPTRSFIPRPTHAGVSVGVSGTSEPSGGKRTARRPRGAAASRWRSVSVTTRTAVRTWLRNILLTSCLVTMPTARSDAGSTTTTHPIFSFTREATTLDSLSSGMAVTHFAAGIMKLATEGMFSLLASEGAFRRPCGSRGLQCRARSPRVETRVSSAAKATPTRRLRRPPRSRRGSETRRLSARPMIVVVRSLATIWLAAQLLQAL